MSELDLEPLPASADVRRVVALALDLAYYRTTPERVRLGQATWVELALAVSELPEGEHYAEVRRRWRRWVRR